MYQVAQGFVHNFGGLLGFSFSIFSVNVYQSAFKQHDYYLVYLKLDSTSDQHSTSHGKAPLSEEISRMITSTLFIRSWYKRNELGLRLAAYNSAVTSSGAFGGLLAVTFDLVVSQVRLVKYRYDRRPSRTWMDSEGDRLGMLMPLC